VLLAVLVAATFVLMLVAVSHLRGSTDAQERSRNVTSATLRLEQVVNQLETSLRAFVVSGNPRFLASWRQGRRHLGPALGSLNELVAAQPGQQARATQLSSQINTYVVDYGEPLIGIFHIQPRAARAPVATREGLFRINTIRTSLGRLLDSEAAIASADSAAARHNADTAVHIGIGALAAASALLVLYGLFIARGVAKPVRSVARAASNVAAGDLSTRLPEDGAAELLALRSAFNTMARSLEQGKRALEAQNEELRQSERLKSQLVSIVSHELRNPLTSILGYTTLMLRREFSAEDMRRYLEIIHQQGTRLTSLIDHFLDSENVASGKVEIAQVPFDLKPLLLEEVKLVADKVTHHQVEIEIEPETLPVSGDRARIAQVFSNLLENGVKYSPDGGRIDVRAGVAGDVVRVSVRDEGIGVPVEYQRQIFTKFFRGNARESGISGTGLGLSVSREIIEAHGGRIDFTSAPGEGSRFWFDLPLDRSQDRDTPLAGAARAG
jgi:signal transduction histidine kinase